MNGRVYDPEIGRFLSADPYIQFPDNAQSYNRYSYVLNNPLSFTDPSGFFLGRLFKGVVRFFKSALKSEVVRTVAAVAVNFIPGMPPGLGGVLLKGFLAGFIGSGGELKGGLIGAATAAAFYGPENPAFLSSEHLQKVAAHGVVGGLAIRLQHQLGVGFSETGGFALEEAGSFAAGGIAGRFIGSIVRFLGFGRATLPIDRLIQSAGELTRLKGGVRQGTVYGNADEIFDELSRGRTRIPSGAYRLSDGTIINLHRSTKSESRTPSIDINRSGRIYKIRVQER